MTAYYNEHDKFAAAWLRNLIENNLIAPGEVDERSIVDVQPADVRVFTQCHFFAGIGIWSHALRQAGWPDDRPIWTGSCPCQGFSVAGAGKGFDDERHLWPEFFRLIRECRPVCVAGEQVASPLALAWLDLVHDDLEGAGYAVGAADLCAASAGAPHIRQRLYWMANAAPGGLRIDGSAPREAGHAPQCESAGRLGDTSEPRSGQPSDRDVQRSGRFVQFEKDPLAGFWGGADWLRCKPEEGFPEGRFRPVESGTFPLAHGHTSRVGKLRAYGNSLCAPVAKAFIEAMMECIPKEVEQ